MSRISFDPTVPKQLKQTQEWFASIITQPINYFNEIAPITPSGRPIAEEAPEYICASPTLQPHQRVELYSQQYWWRLLKILHENVPFVTRLFGYTDFNQTIGSPYLSAFPPNHWALLKLQDRLPKWIRESYHAEDRSLVLNATRIDCAFMSAFATPRLPSLTLPQVMDEKALETLLDIPLRHQPYLHLFDLSRDLFTFRDLFLEEGDGDYWMDRAFPPLKKGKFYAVIYRNPHNRVLWKSISQAEYQYLSLFKRGLTVNRSLEWLERQPLEVSSNLHTWLREWMALGWLGQTTS